MEKKEFVVVDKNTLLNLISRAHKWCAIWGHSELLSELDDDELDAIFLEYAESSGLTSPSDFCGYEAIAVLSERDLDFYEVEKYDKRENN